MSKIIQAAQLARWAHEYQVRKYTGTPYVWHPMRVAGHTSMLPKADGSWVCAAWLHDTLEDCADLVTEKMLLDIFGHDVTRIVQELTNPSKQHPKLSRRERKEMDWAHLKGVSDVAKYIKYIDRIDNLREMGGAPNDFKNLYFHESRLLAKAMYDGSDDTNVDLNAMLIHEVITMELGSR
jgi:(p)ppGpp synthase/HD superfamily hydrolase